MLRPVLTRGIAMDGIHQFSVTIPIHRLDAFDAHLSALRHVSHRPHPYNVRLIRNTIDTSQQDHATSIQYSALELLGDRDEAIHVQFLLQELNLSDPTDRWIITYKQYLPR